MSDSDFLGFFFTVSCLIGFTLLAIIFILAIVGLISQSKNQNNISQRAQRPHQKPPSAPPTFRVISVQRTYTNSNAPTSIRVPKEWGQRVQRPPSIQVHHNQQTCIVCKETINYAYMNKGWSICPNTKKLVHGHCHDAWIEAKRSGCAACQSNDHQMKKIRYPK